MENERPESATSPRRENSFRPNPQNLICLHKAIGNCMLLLYFTGHMWQQPGRPRFPPGRVPGIELAVAPGTVGQEWLRLWGNTRTAKDPSRSKNHNGNH